MNAISNTGVGTPRWPREPFPAAAPPPGVSAPLPSSLSGDLPFGALVAPGV